MKPKILVDEPVVRSEKLYSNHAIESTKNVLEKVLESFPVKGYRLIGKTGTARMMRMREYSTKDHRFTCAGMIESGDYKRVIVTFVLNSKKSHLWARQVAAPLFHRVAKRVAYHELGHQR